MKCQTTQVAYVCSECDDYKIFDVNIFDFSGSRTKVHTCDCGKSVFSITKNSVKSFKVEMYCPVCKQNHTYMVPYNQFFTNDVFAFSCPYFEAELFFTGSKDKLKEKLNEFNEPNEYEEKTHILYDRDTIEKMVTLSKTVYEHPEKINICDCKGTYSVAYNEKGIYIICDKCNYAMPVAFDQINKVLNEIL